MSKQEILKGEYSELLSFKQRVEEVLSTTPPLSTYQAAEFTLPSRIFEQGEYLEFGYSGEHIPSIGAKDTDILTIRCKKREAEYSFGQVMRYHNYDTTLVPAYGLVEYKGGKLVVSKLFSDILSSWLPVEPKESTPKNQLPSGGHKVAYMNYSDKVSKEAYVARMSRTFDQISTQSKKAATKKAYDTGITLLDLGEEQIRRYKYVNEFNKKTRINNYYLTAHFIKSLGLMETDLPVEGIEFLIKLLGGQIGSQASQTLLALENRIAEIKYNANRLKPLVCALCKLPETIPYHVLETAYGSFLAYLKEDTDYLYDFLKANQIPTSYEYDPLKFTFPLPSSIYEIKHIYWFGWDTENIYLPAVREMMLWEKYGEQLKQIVNNQK